MQLVLYLIHSMELPQVQFQYGCLTWDVMEERNIWMSAHFMGGDQTTTTVDHIMMMLVWCALMVRMLNHFGHL